MDREAGSQLDREVACLSARVAGSQLDREVACLSARAADNQLDREVDFLLVPVVAEPLIATDSVASIRSNIAACV